VARLAHEVERAERVIKQTTRRLAGERVIPDRVISLSLSAFSSACHYVPSPVKEGSGTLAWSTVASIEARPLEALGLGRRRLSVEH
jgi:hypothetical protein